MLKICLRMIFFRNVIRNVKEFLQVLSMLFRKYNHFFDTFSHGRISWCCIISSMFPAKIPDTVLQFPRLTVLLLKVKSSNFFNTTSKTTTHKYQDSALLHFSQVKQKLLASAPKNVKSICKCFQNRYDYLTESTINGSTVRDTIT